MRVLIAGGSGLIGQALRSFLEEEGHLVHFLERKEGARLFWDPETHFLPQELVSGYDVIVNLCGHSIVSGFWTKKQKDKILQSRVKATKLLVETINALKVKPKVFISASATGFYGNTCDEEVTEEHPKGQGFLAEVCQAWENEAKRVLDVRLALLRIGMVLSKNGGALSKMLPIFRLGLGGKIGSGKQWMSWIAIDDLVRAIYFVMTHDVEGPVNMTSPLPVTNEAFTKVLGAVLHRPVCFPVPKCLLRVFLREMADETMLCSQKVVPKKLMELGFDFHYADIGQALSLLH